MTTTAQRLAQLKPKERKAVLAGMSERELAYLDYSWQFCANRIRHPPPPPWLLWLMCAGRGAGKSWTGAQWVRNQIEIGKRRLIALVAPTRLAGRKVMVEDGLLRFCPPDNMPTYEMATGVARWPNGGVCHLLTSETPGHIRRAVDSILTAPGATNWNMPDVKHRTSRYLNNRAEYSQRPTQRRERQMQRFKSPSQAQSFLAAHGIIYGHFQPRRHRMIARDYHVLIHVALNAAEVSGNHLCSAAQDALDKFGEGTGFGTRQSSSRKNGP